MIFYSPAIGPFDRGLKLEGTEGFQSFGVLEAQGAGFDDVVFGYKHAVPNRSFSWSLDGVMTHHRAGNDTIDQRAGHDSTWQAEVGRDDHTGFVYVFEYTREQGTFVTDPGLAYKSENFVDVHQHNYEIFTGYRVIGPQYAPVLGFTLNADLRGPQAFFDLNGTLAPNGPIKKADLFITGDRWVDGSGAVHQSDTSINGDLQFKNGFHIGGGPSVSTLRAYGSGLIGYPSTPAASRARTTSTTSTPGGRKGRRRRTPPPTAGDPSGTRACSR